MLWYQAMQLKQWGLTGIVLFDLLTKELADADVDRLLLQLFNLAGNNYYIHQCKAAYSQQCSAAVCKS